MIVLDLFCGSKCWSKAFAELGWETYTLDIEAKFNATATADIHQWEPPARLIGNVDVVTIGVPCTAYSTACKNKNGCEVPGNTSAVVACI